MDRAVDLMFEIFFPIRQKKKKEIHQTRISNIYLVRAPLYEVDESGCGDGFDVMGGATSCRPLLDPHMIDTFPCCGTFTVNTEQTEALLKVIRRHASNQTVADPGFPRGSQPQGIGGGVPTYYLAKIWQKLHTTWKFYREGDTGPKLCYVILIDVS